jgi:hypothetical protein
MIKVKHGRSQVVFPVVGNEYTFLRVIEDAVRHWVSKRVFSLPKIQKLSNSSDYELRDEDQKFTWPYSENVLSHISKEETIVKLVKKKVTSDAPATKDSAVAKFIETVTTEDITPRKKI